MRDADRPIGKLRKAPSLSARRKANQGRSRRAPSEQDDADTMRDDNHRPARGIVLGLAPALLIWAGLIALFGKLMR